MSLSLFFSLSLSIFFTVYIKLLYIIYVLTTYVYIHIVIIIPIYTYITTYYYIYITTYTLLYIHIYAIYTYSTMYVHILLYNLGIGRNSGKNVSVIFTFMSYTDKKKKIQANKILANVIFLQKKYPLDYANSFFWWKVSGTHCLVAIPNLCYYLLHFLF